MKGKGTICIAGKNSIAVAGLYFIYEQFRENYNIVVLPDDKDSGLDEWQPSLKKHATLLGLNLVSLSDVYEVEDLCFISLEYFKLIKPEKFKDARLYNIHFSLLPAYKGMYTSAHPILNGEKRSGCTIHHIDEGIDTGSIITQISFPMKKDIYCKELYEKYLLNGQKLVEKTIGNIIEDNYDAIPQSSEGHSYYSKNSINYSDLKIKFDSTTTSDVVRQINAFTFRDFQLPFIEGHHVFGVSETDLVSSQSPGTITYEDDYTIHLSTEERDVIVEKDTFDQFLEAVESENVLNIKRLVKQNPRLLKESNNQGWSGLIIAAYNGLESSLATLIECGADINKTNPKGTTPLMYATEHAINSGNTNGMEMLLEQGANPRVKDILRRDIYSYLDKQKPFFSMIQKILSRAD